MDCIWSAYSDHIEIRARKMGKNGQQLINSMRLDPSLIKTAKSMEPVIQILYNIHEQFQKFDRTPIDVLENFLEKTGYGK